MRRRHVECEGIEAEAQWLARLSEAAAPLPPGASLTVALPRPWGLRIIHLDPCPCGDPACRKLSVRLAAIRRGPGRLRRAWAALCRGLRWLVGATLPRPREDA